MNHISFQFLTFYNKIQKINPNFKFVTIDFVSKIVDRRDSSPVAQHFLKKLIYL